MSGELVVIAFTLLAIGVPISMVVFGWFTKPSAHRQLAEGEIKVKPSRLSRDALLARRQGQYAHLGMDFHTRQSVDLPESVRFTNVINIGPTGAGKTFYFLNSLIARDIRVGHNSVVIFDSQRDLTLSVKALCEQFGRELVTFPDAGFNPLGGEGTARDRAELFGNLYAQAVEIGKESAAQFYLRETQKFIRTIVPLYERAYAQPMILQELLYLCRRKDMRQRLIRDAGPCPELDDYQLYYGEEDRLTPNNTTNSSDFRKIVSGLEDFISVLTQGDRVHLYNQRHAPSLASLIEGEKVIVIREGGSQNTQQRPLGLLFMIGLQDHITHRDLARELHPVFIYADEAPLYINHNTPDTIAANRKYHASFHLGFQSIAQLDAATSKQSETILNNCRTWVVHGGLLEADARVVADNIGQRLMVLKGISETQRQGQGGLTQTQQTGYDYLMPPHYIRNLSSQYALVLTIHERETEPVHMVVKPPAVTIPRTTYAPPAVQPFAPRTVWAERDEGLRKQHPTSPGPQPGPPPAPAGIIVDADPPQPVAPAVVSTPASIPASIDAATTSASAPAATSTTSTTGSQQASIKASTKASIDGKHARRGGQQKRGEPRQPRSPRARMPDWTEEV